MKAVMYHYVRPYNPELPGLQHLSLDNFRKQLDYFQETEGIMAKDIFLDAVQRQKPLDKGIVLTFDDGLKCHYEHVLPELKRRGLWGIFYVSTGMYHTRKVVDVHRIHILLAKVSSQLLYEQLGEIVTEDMLTDQSIQAFRQHTYSVQSNDEWTVLVKRMMNYYISYAHREAVLDSLISMNHLEGFDDYEKYYINCAEIREMHAQGMVMGSHTVNHPVLSKLPVDQQQAEIEDSFGFLESICGRFPIRTFCYPYGGFHSFTADTERILDNFDCLFSFNVEQRDISSDDLQQRPQALPRYDCNQFKYGQVAR